MNRFEKSADKPRPLGPMDNDSNPDSYADNPTHSQVIKNESIESQEEHVVKHKDLMDRRQKY